MSIVLSIWNLLNIIVVGMIEIVIVKCGLIRLWMQLLCFEFEWLNYVIIVMFWIWMVKLCHNGYVLLMVKLSHISYIEKVVFMKL